MAPGAPDFLVVGHVVQDLLPDGSWRLGGAASYAALLARNLGLKTAVLTACAADLPLAELLPEIEQRVVPSRRTTRFRNVYEGGRRTQWAPSRAAPLTVESLPDEWRESGIVFLAPVAGEVDARLAAAFSQARLVGAGAQGWLRRIAVDDRVEALPADAWDAAAVLENVQALFVSDEDVSVEEAPRALAEWAAQMDVLAFTRGYGGADVCYRGDWRRVGAAKANPVDLTGAGDTFAAGFLVRYAECGDPWEATRFGAAAAALVIEAVGVSGVPGREAVDRRLRVVDK
jgi:sugar/nucleoside kinase (ribokinase family)